MRNRMLSAAALAVAAVLPAACSGGDEAAEQAATAPEAPEGIAVSNARLMLPPVAGNPAALYFDITNSSQSPVMIRSAHVEGAGTAMLHMMGEWSGQPDMQEISQQPVGAGETVKFEPGGLHVMANDVSDALAPGTSTEVTLTFTGGDKISFPAEVRAAGDER